MNDRHRIKPVELIEDETEVYETEEDRQAYAEALLDLKCGDVSDFEKLESAWLRGESADFCSEMPKQA